MYTLQELEISNVLPTAQGTFIFAKYNGWFHEYVFLIQKDGTVKGKTSGGEWVELTDEACGFIQTRVQSQIFRNNRITYGQ